MKSERRRPCCCIPSTGLDNTKIESATDRSNNRCRYLQDSDTKCCDGVLNNDSSQHKMVIKSGPYGLHAIASQDIKAGCVILQCLPLAHSILVPPGGMEDDEDDGSRRKKICSRCFIQEGDTNIDTSSENVRKEKFGRCSKCRMVYYCSRSCQSQDWIEQHKLECQYYVKRQKLHQSTPYAANSDEDAIPLLLRTFHSLKYLREKNSVEEEEGAIHQHHGSDDMIISCGPDHFASLIVSSKCYSFAKTDGSAMILAKDLMESYAMKGLSSTTKQSSKDADKTCKTKAALDIWGYTEGSDNDKQLEVKTHDTAILRTLNAFQKNNFGIVNSLHTAIGEGVYPCAALLNHSCYPNCILRYKLGSSTIKDYHPPILQIVACRDILLGDELCHSYVDLALTTHERQARLLDTHGFECECKRCTKNGCLIMLPENRNEWELWPLRNGLQSHGGDQSVDEKMPMRKVDLDDAMTGSCGLSQSELAQINHHSQVLQHKASQAMVVGDEDGELHYYLKEAIELYRPREGSNVWFSPFHSQLYALRGSYLSAMLANGNIHGAVHECTHIVSFLVVAFSHVQNHPLLGLQLYTLGDLYSAAASMDDEEEEDGTERRSNTKKAKLAYTWARDVMKVSHGETDHMVQVLNDNLSSMN